MSNLLSLKRQRAAWKGSLRVWHYPCPSTAAGRGVPAGARSTTGPVATSGSMHMSPACLRGHGEGQPGAHPWHGWQLGPWPPRGRGGASPGSRGEHLPAQPEAIVWHRCQRGGGSWHSPTAGSTRCLLLLSNLAHATRCCLPALPAPVPSARAASKLGELDGMAHAILPAVSTEREFAFAEHEQIKK